MDIPVYAVTGFLDSGKTNFINGILQDGFAKQDKTLLLCCEEGDEEYDVKALTNVKVELIDEEEGFNRAALKALEKKHHPRQIVIEYNGMWGFERFNELPANWVLYQIMNFVYAPSFDVMARNMGQLMMEKIKNADMLVFNRATPEVAAALRRRHLPENIYEAVLSGRKIYVIDNSIVFQKEKYFTRHYAADGTRATYEMVAEPNGYRIYEVKLS